MNQNIYATTLPMNQNFAGYNPTNPTAQAAGVMSPFWDPWDSPDLWDWGRTQPWNWDWDPLGGLGGGGGWDNWPSIAEWLRQISLNNPPEPPYFPGSPAPASTPPNRTSRGIVSGIAGLAPVIGGALARTPTPTTNPDLEKQFSDFLAQTLQRYPEFLANLQQNPQQGIVNLLENFFQDYNWQTQQASADLQNQGMTQLGQGWGLLNNLAQGIYPQSEFGKGIQDQLQALIAGGGLSPEYVQAARRNILEPEKQALMGKLNQMAGGTALLTSPQFIEQLGRQESRFGDQLTMQGYQNLSNFINQALQSEQQGIGAGQNLAQLYNQYGQGNVQTAQKMLNDFVSQMQSFTGQQQNYNLGLKEIESNLYRSIVSGLFNDKWEQIKQEIEAAKRSGALLEKGLEVIPTLWKILFP